MHCNGILRLGGQHASVQFGGVGAGWIDQRARFPQLSGLLQDCIDFGLQGFRLRERCSDRLHALELGIGREGAIEVGQRCSDVLSLGILFRQAAVSHGDRIERSQRRAVVRHQPQHFLVGDDGGLHGRHVVQARTRQQALRIGEQPLGVTQVRQAVEQYR